MRTPPTIRKLIGKRVEWEYSIDRNRGSCLVRSGIVIEVKGRNVLIDYGDMNDWIWLPDIHNLREVPNVKVTGRPIK